MASSINLYEIDSNTNKITSYQPLLLNLKSNLRKHALEVAINWYKVSTVNKNRLKPTFTRYVSIIKLNGERRQKTGSQNSLTKRVLAPSFYKIHNIGLAFRLGASMPLVHWLAALFPTSSACIQ
jgi:elongation factor P--beta-lysine ligase